jgi:hypothetical protein
VIGTDAGSSPGCFRQWLALLALADASFDVLVTIDRNLRYQQDLTGQGIALLIMRALTNGVVWMLQRAS